MSCNTCFHCSMAAPIATVNVLPGPEWPTVRLCAQCLADYGDCRKPWCARDLRRRLIMYFVERYEANNPRHVHKKRTETKSNECVL